MESDGFLPWVGELARLHSRRLMGVAMAEGLTSTESLDAVQEGLRTFLGMPLARQMAQDQDDSAKFLAVVVRNVARNMRRKHHRARVHEAWDDEVAADADPSVDDLIGLAEQRVRLLGCVATLSAVQRSVVTLRMLEELSGDETARALGLQSGHVAVLLHRAKKELRQCFD